MKTLLLSVLLFFVSQVSQAYLEFEVQPLSVQSKSKVQVLGVQVTQESQEQRGVIFTGDAAQQVAQSYHYSDFDSSQQMIVMTGQECDSLVGDSIYGIHRTTDLILITSSMFARSALSLAFDVINAGTRFLWLDVSTRHTRGKSLVKGVLYAPNQETYVVDDRGFSLVSTPVYIISRTFEFICDIPGYLGLWFLECY